MLTKEEISICESLGLAWNAFIAMQQGHPDDVSEFKFHVHALQAIVMARSAQRSHPEVFPRHECNIPKPKPLPDDGEYISPSTARAIARTLRTLKNDEGLQI